MNKIFQLSGIVISLITFVVKKLEGSFWIAAKRFNGAELRNEFVIQKNEMQVADAR